MRFLVHDRWEIISIYLLLIEIMNVWGYIDRISHTLSGCSNVELIFKVLLSLRELIVLL